MRTRPNTSFREFQEFLERSSVLSGSLELKLYGRAENQVNQRLLRQYFSPYSNISASNPIYEHLSSQIVTAFSDKVLNFDSDEFNRIYIPNAQNIKFDAKIRMSILKIDSVVSKKVTKLMKDNHKDSFVSKLKSPVNDTKLAFIIVGTVGAGKTTFLHFLEKIKLKDLIETENSNFHWIRIDFLESTSDASYSQFIYNNLFEYINNSELGDADKSIHFAYENEINALKKGPLKFLNSEEQRNQAIANIIMDDFNSKIPYIEKILKYHANVSNIFLIVDNIDQIDSDAKQSELFSATLSIAKKLNLSLIICLRQSTYVRNRNSPLINAYDYEYGQIEPPSISVVLSKRFDLLEKLASGISFNYISENGIGMTVNDASEIIGLLRQSVLGTEVGNQIEVLASEDIRLALRMTRDFLEKGYSKPTQAIQTHHTGKKYTLPKHEALRAIIVGNHNVYDENFSSLGNVFDSKLLIHNLQLLKLFILNACVNQASHTQFEGIDGDEIDKHLKNIGVGSKYTRETLNKLCEQRFLFKPSNNISEEITMYAPSRLGGYIVRNLMTDFTFLENMLFDTYISEDRTWEKIKELSHKIESERNVVSKIDLRIERLNLFWDYLMNVYQILLIEAHKRSLPIEWCNNLFEDNTHTFKSNLENARNSAIRNYGK